MREICWFSPGYRSAYFLLFLTMNSEPKAVETYQKILLQIILGLHTDVLGRCFVNICLDTDCVNIYINSDYDSIWTIVSVPEKVSFISRFCTSYLHFSFGVLIFTCRFMSFLKWIWMLFTLNISSKIFTLQIITDKPT